MKYLFQNNDNFFYVFFKFNINLLSFVENFSTTSGNRNLDYSGDLCE